MSILSGLAWLVFPLLILAVTTMIVLAVAERRGGVNEDDERW